MLISLLISCNISIDTEGTLSDLDLEVFTKVDNESDADLEFADDVDPGVVRIDCPDGLERDIALFVTDGTLVINADGDPDRGGACLLGLPAPDIRSIIVRGNGEVVSRGTLRSLELVDVRGGGSVDLDTVIVPSIDLLASGNGDLTIHWLEAALIGIEIHGTGGMHLAGEGGHADLRITGSGSLDAADLVVDSLAAELSGSGDATITVTGLVELDVSGSGVLVTGQE